MKIADTKNSCCAQAGDREYDDWRGIISNVKVYDIDECIKASKYPMATDTGEVDDQITGTQLKLTQSGKGEGHDQFLTGIRVNFDLTCSIKMWTEAERYRFLEFVSSQSTMHRIAKFDLDKQYMKYVDPRIVKIMNELKDTYNDIEDKASQEAKNAYLKLLYSNPCGFKLTARLTTNYRSLKTIYSQRRSHRLPEWQLFCDWIETLPHAADFIIGSKTEKRAKKLDA
ncbi:MAG: hypothetical protein FWH17_08155 [Oscillospiraceae bacterium]|nr:hypothetical protein [Oscillospiraceae bacterium]